MTRTDETACAAADVWFQLVRAHRAMDRALSAILAPHGLTIPQTEILVMLKKKGPQLQHALAEGLCVTKGNVTQVIDRLHRSGLLLRTEIAENRRANRLEITPHGLDKLHAVFPAFSKYLEVLFAEFDERRCGRLVADLHDLERAAGST